MQGGIFFINLLEGVDGTIAEFDPALWGGMIDRVLVRARDKIDFIFKGNLYTVTVGG